MEQKPSCHAEVYSQTVSSPFQLQRSPSEFSLGEALGVLTGEVHEVRRPPILKGTRMEKSASFGRSTGISPDIMNGFSSIGELTETLVCTQNLTPKNSCISATMDSQSSICVGNPISAAKPIGRDNQARGAYSGSGEQSDEDGFEIEVGPCGDSTDSLYIKRFRRYPI
ncbi:hypothetical protein ACFX2I_043437 [Malus domestica]|uniref:Uncharacterized protein n=1 Tax=Malus domestica TaxID=3750 RepID=A0A498JAT9_MALDO|nr:hypothetical protein DVH24_020910 [Malus domestica]